MKFQWPENTSEVFSTEIITCQHDGHESEHFADEGLADLLDRYPRDEMGIYKFPEHAEGKVKAIHGKAENLTGAELLEAVKRGQIWLNLRAVNNHLEEFEAIKQQLFSQLDDAASISSMKQDVGVLISSPNIHVHYHLDIPFVCLVQVRGEKTVSLYPAEPPFATASQIEAVVLKEQEEEMSFQHSFDEHVTALEMKPGMAVTWPQNAPHRVQNGDMLNVSLSCEYMTTSGLLRANAMYTNGVMRRSMGIDSGLPAKSGLGMIAKAVIARFIKVFKKTVEQKHTPITFEIDKETLLAKDIS